ncbi:MAG: hypothetical protein V4508_21660, partial [Pseudomonadota bacterium]
MTRMVACAALALVCGVAHGASLETESRAEAAYFTSAYDGAQFRLASFKCSAPAFPAVSASPDSARRVEKSLAAWRSCYARFSAKLGAALPAGKVIPDDVAKAMTADDRNKAKALMEKVYADIAAEGREQDDKVNAGAKTWAEATASRPKGSDPGSSVGGLT